jgi:hypothetical protein
MVVQILSVPVCVECRATVETLTRLADEYQVIRVERLNIADWPELLDRYGLLSFEYDVLDTHAVAINDRLAGLGHPSEDTLRGWLDEALSKERSP